jgi:dipeptidase E
LRAGLALDQNEEGIVRLLLTSAGITNPSIYQALLALLGKPIAEASALCIPTATYGHPMIGPNAAWRFISGNEPRTPMVELGWQSMGVLELTALPSLDRARWERWVEETDVLLVNGGDPLYLHYWMRQSGLADLLLSWPGVYVGLSAGSMVMTPRIGQEFVNWSPPSGGDETLGLVEFTIYPHLDHPELPENTMANAERWAANMPGPAYAIDDETAIRVVDGDVEVISEGHWQRFNP